MMNSEKSAWLRVSEPGCKGTGYLNTDYFIWSLIEMASAEVLAGEAELNGPLTRERLVAILSETFENSNSETVQDSIASVLKQLSHVSSKHKFIVNVTVLKPENVDSTQLTINNYLGSSWDDKSDGAFHHQIEQRSEKDQDGGIANQLISVYWISV